MKKIILIPTYNERKNIEKLIPEIFKLVPEVFVYIVDDNSPDDTAGAVRGLTEHFPNLLLIRREKKEGLGKAYIDAFRFCLQDSEVDRVVMMDADFSHDPKYLPLILKEGKEADVVIGSRYIKGGGTVGWELWRRLLSRWGNFYCRIITRLPIRDCTGGFNLIKTSFLRRIDFDYFDNSGYAFQVELKYALSRLQARFREVPIIFKNRFEGESKISNHIIQEGILAPWKLIFKK